MLSLAANPATAQETQSSPSPAVTPTGDSLAESIAAMQKLPVVQVGEQGILSAEFIYPLEGRPTPECHASTIVDTSDGLVAAWFGGLHENHPEVGIWVARHDGSQWRAPVEVVDGSEGEQQEYACWNPVLFQPPAGHFGYFIKWASVQGCGGAWPPLPQTTGTWSKPWRLGTSSQLFAQNRNLLGPVKNRPLQLADGSVICPSSSENEGWRIHFEISTDIERLSDATWQVVGPLQAGEQLDAIQPACSPILTVACKSYVVLDKACWGRAGRAMQEKAGGQCSRWRSPIPTQAQTR
ncbi:MAG: exo-alpha-sialidase [Pirellulaceae bacterium]